MTRHIVHALLGGALFTAALHAQAPAKSPAAAPAAKEIVLTATAANVKESGTPVKIRIFRWSTDEERTPLVVALAAPPPAPAGRGGRAGAGAPGAGGGRAAANGGRGGAPAEAPAASGGNAAAAQQPPAAAAARQGGGGRAGRGRGGAEATPLTPLQAFTAALQKAPTVGYIWTTDVTGYSIKYAWHAAQPDGTERIVLATDRRLGAYSPAWTLSGGGTPTDYEFTVIEIHSDTKTGEGKASLTTRIVADKDANLLGLENYATAPVVLQNVKRSTN